MSAKINATARIFNHLLGPEPTVSLMFESDRGGHHERRRVDPDSQQKVDHARAPPSVPVRLRPSTGPDDMDRV